MKRLFSIFLVICELCLLCCTTPNNKEQLTYLGQVGFRRSYAGHENWSQAELDSVEKSNPYYLDGYDSSDRKVIGILATLDIADAEQLFLDKIDQNLKDTIVLVAHDEGNDTAFIKYDTSTILSASIILRNKKLLDSIPIERATLPDVSHLINLKERSNRYIVFLNQYYISNGDNYDVSVYERK